MNKYQQTIFDDLTTLVANTDDFFCQDFEFNNRNLRIFNYRMASYMDFMKPSALECRGVMFDVTDAESVELVALPMEKFFNLNENPFTMDLDLTTIDSIDLKADGSLISTYLIDDTLYLKSKGSISSEQAIDAMEWLGRPEQSELHESLTVLTRKGFTVNMEWCAPFNRIVIRYQEPHLTILNVRDRMNGGYVSRENAIECDDRPDVLADHWVDVLDLPDDLGAWVASIPDMEDIEGYIFRLHSGQAVKVKTLWYLVQHRAKDSVNSDRRLFETVVADAQDDLRSLFHDDPWVIGRIDWMEELVGAEYNKMVATVENFYNANKTLDRKDFAIKAKAEVKGLWFGLCMNLYLEKPVEYKQFMMSKWKEYGIKDQRK